MRRLFWISTSLFWLAVAGFWVAPLWLPEDMSSREAGAQAAERRYTLAELAGHARPEDCWMAIGGVVYDFTAYLPQHPADPALLRAWCGKEASQAYQTKTRGRPHSPYADSLLPKYRIGRLAEAPAR